LITGLVNGESYTAHVSATNSAGPGAWSAWTGTLVPAGPSSEPLGLNGRVGDNFAIVSWSAPADWGGSAVSTYVIDVSAAGLTQQLTTPDTQAMLLGLANGVAHTVRVAAVTDYGQGAWSNPITLTPKSLLLGAPTSVSTVRTARGVTVSWRPPATGQATRYVVAASINGAPFRRVATTSTARASFAAGPKARVIQVRVAAIDDHGRGPWSVPVHVMRRTLAETGPTRHDQSTDISHHK